MNLSEKIMDMTKNKSMEINNSNKYLLMSKLCKLVEEIKNDNDVVEHFLNNLYNRYCNIFIDKSENDLKEGQVNTISIDTILRNVKIFSSGREAIKKLGLQDKTFRCIEKIINVLEAEQLINKNEVDPNILMLESANQIATALQTFYYPTSNNKLIKYVREFGDKISGRYYVYRLSIDSQDCIMSSRLDIKYIKENNLIKTTESVAVSRKGISVELTGTIVKSPDHGGVIYMLSRTMKDSIKGLTFTVIFNAGDKTDSLINSDESQLKDFKSFTGTTIGIGPEGLSFQRVHFERTEIDEDIKITFFTLDEFKKKIEGADTIINKLITNPITKT